MSNTIIGPRRAGVWNSLFGFSAQFGASGGASGFASGPNTNFPLPSIPVAQAFRYWWTVQSIRVQCSLPYSYGGAYTLDTDWFPYGPEILTGSVPTFLPRAWCNNPSGNMSSPLLTPVMADRYLGLISPPYNAIAIAINGEHLIQFFNRNNQGNSGPTSSGNPSPASLVWDDSTPGNVFMGFSVGINIGGSGSGNPIPGGNAAATTNTQPYPVGGTVSYGPFGPVLSGAYNSFTASLDGIPFTMYANTAYNVTAGTLTISTRDS